MKRAARWMLVVALAAGIGAAVMKEPEVPASAEMSAASVLVYTTRNAKTYHDQECRRFSRVRAADIISLNREDAEASGRTACGECFLR